MLPFRTSLISIFLKNHNLEDGWTNNQDALPKKKRPSNHFWGKVGSILLDSCIPHRSSTHGGEVIIKTVEHRI